MAHDTDFDLYPGGLGVIDSLSRRFLGGRSVHMAANGLLQRLSRSFLRHAPARMFPDRRAGRILDELVERRSAAEGHERVAYGIVLENVHAFGGCIWPTASSFYESLWLRDAYFMARFTRMPDLEHRILEEFGGWQGNNGQIPTEVYFPGIVKHYRDDESTLLFFVWGCEAGYENARQLASAWKFSSSRAPNGKYMSPGGTRRSIIDALEFPEESCIAYNQGIYAVAAALAHKKGLCDAETAENAAEEYRRLAGATSSGYLPMSDTLPYLDPTALFGEYLALTVLGESLLGTEIVQKTKEALDRVKVGEYGYRITREDGGRIPKARFILGWGDDYQTAKWPLLSNWVLSVFHMHGLIGENYKPEILEWLDKIEWAEYENLRGMHYQDNSLPNIDPAKRRHAWNVFILEQHRAVSEYFERAA